MPDANKKMKESVLQKRNKFILGVVVLLIVDILWVVSAELSERIFHNENFDKPFFTTYFKTSMFVLYLLGFAVFKRWQYQCFHCFAYKQMPVDLLREVERVSHQEVKPKEVSGCTSSSSLNLSGCSTPVLTDGNFTPPRYENMTDDDLSSLGEFEDLNPKAVKFNSVREVRSLSSKYTDAQILARMSQNSIEQLRNILVYVNDKMSLYETVKLSLLFVVLWVFATLMYQEALAITSAAVTNILSSTSGIFTLVLAAIFPSSISDKFTVSKLIAVLVSFAGVFLVIWTDPSQRDKSINMGAIFALLGAALYACYLVMIRRKVGDDSKLDIPLFFGFVGLFGLLFFWPGIVILHYTGIETFEFPKNNMTWVYLVVNAVFGTALSELLWLWGCFLTSSLLATLSLGLVIPLTMVWDMFFNKIEFSWLFICGAIPILLSFVAVSTLTHKGDWDPVKDLVMKIWNCGKVSSEENEKLLQACEDDSGSKNSQENCS